MAIASVDKTSDLTRQEVWDEVERLIGQGVPVSRATARFGLHRTAYYKRLQRNGASSTNEDPAPQSTSENFRGRDVNANYDTASPLDEVRTSASENNDNRATA